MKKYSLIITENDGVTKVSATNEGYNPLELLGIFKLKEADILKQIEGVITPDIVYERTVVKDEEKGAVENETL